MKKVLYIVVGVLLVMPFLGSSQQLQRIANSPSNEVYDLLVDKKGFLWVAHNLGVSRFDGISFTSFTNQEQSAISMTDLIEDNYGRIWCHNFNSQVFYIEHDKLHYLKEYDFKQESVFPRMILFNDELVVTSNKGLFMCNTKTLKCRYIVDSSLFYYHKNYGGTGATEVCVIGKKLLVHAGTLGDWGGYLYTGGSKLKRLALPTDSIRHFAKLELYANSDTAYIIDNVAGIMRGVVVKNDSLLVTVMQKKVASTINTISQAGDKLWVNTKTASFLLNGKDTVKNFNVTATAKSKGDINWFGSLNKGLFYMKNDAGWKKVAEELLQDDDYICSLLKYQLWFVLCSSKGHVFMLGKNGNFEQISTSPLQRGITESITHAYGNGFIISNSKAMYLLNAQTKSIRLCDSLSAFKQITLKGNIAYLSHSNGFIVKDARVWGITGIPNPIGLSSLSNKILFPTPAYNTRGSKKQSRCRALIYDSTNGTLLAAFADGLQRVSDSTMTPVLYGRKPLYISSLANYLKKIYAGSFNDGLFVIENGVVKKISDNEESQQDAIVKVKCCNNHLWVFRAHDIELVDAATGTFIKDMFPLPVSNAEVIDVDEDDNNIYLATHKGLYTLPRTQKYEALKTDPYLLYTVINSRDTVFGNLPSLASNRNNLLFRFAIPVYEHAERLHFKYRLTGEDSTWYYTREEQRDIQFNSLKHGDYKLEIVAIQDNDIISNNTFVVTFSINRPWYNTWLFYMVVSVIIVSITIAIQQYRLRQILKVERVRRKIASDLHDDIGSTLSSINVYSEIAKKEDNNKEYINTIQQNTVSIINNLDDLVWNINPKNDVLENMIARMRQFAEPLLAEKGIGCTFNIDADNLHVFITPDARTNIYLLFKEAVNNTIKHSGCTACNIHILQRGKSFILTIADNGKGFDAKIINRHRNGLHNMQQRAADITGELTIYSNHGQGAVITLTCHLK